MDDIDPSAAIDLALGQLERQRAVHVEMMGAEPFAVLAHVQRPGAVATVLQNDTMQVTVVVDHHEGAWRMPTMLNGTVRRTTERAPETGPIGLQAKNVKKVHWPQSDPKDTDTERYWIAVTGLAANDVDHVVVTGTIDTFRAVPDDDGLVLALIRAADKSTPVIVVHTKDGREVPAKP